MPSVRFGNGGLFSLFGREPKYSDSRLLNIKATCSSSSDRLVSNYSLKRCIDVEMYKCVILNNLLCVYKHVWPEMLVSDTHQLRIKKY